jgi:hypothetical protein
VGAGAVELYAYVSGIDLRGYGSTTFRKEAKERGAEPDATSSARSSARFRRSCSRWFTRPLFSTSSMCTPDCASRGAFVLHALRATSAGYDQRSRSAFLPDLDFAIVARYAVREVSLATLRAFEAEIRGSSRA